MFSENSASFAPLTWLALNESFIAMFSATCMSISSSEDSGEIRGRSKQSIHQSH